MTFLLLSRPDRRHRRPRHLSRDLPAHLMRDIGLPPWPEPARWPFHPPL